MEEKFNNATPQRPEGARLLDTYLLPIDLEKYIEQIIHEESYQKNGKNAITIFKSKHVTLTIVALQAQETMHPGNETGIGTLILQVIEGQLTFENGGESLILTKNCLLTLKEQLAFNAIANQATICLITLLK